MNKIILLFILSFVCFFAYSSDLVNTAEKEMLLKVSDTYSQCEAYYNIAGMLLNDKKENKAKQQTQTMKAKSNQLALTTAEKLVRFNILDEKKVKKAAENISASNYQAAINKLHNLAKTDQKEFKRKIGVYRKGCRNAINDPAKYSSTILNGIKNKKSKSKLQRKPSITKSSIKIDSKKLIQRINDEDNTTRK